MINWENKKIGLVLSGGGAKGAYQVGMFKALEDLGLRDNIKVISGCSVGAMSAAVYSAAGYQMLFVHLCEFSNILASSVRIPERIMTQSKNMVSRGEVSLEDFATMDRFSKCHPQILDIRLMQTLSREKMSNLRHRIHVCCYSLEEEKPRYFLINGQDYQDQIKLIRASGSIPYLFPAVEYKGNHYLDGGIIPPICKDPAPRDKIPLLPLKDENVDAVLVNFLNPAESVDRSILGENVSYLELRPSRALETSPGAGTLDFTPQKLHSHAELGYLDTIKLFTE